MGKQDGNSMSQPNESMLVFVITVIHADFDEMNINATCESCPAFA
jgi:hypothetical protein